MTEFPRVAKADCTYLRRVRLPTTGYYPEQPVTRAGQMPGFGSQSDASSFDEAPVHLSFNEKLPKGHEGSAAYRGMLAIQTIEHQRPSPIHHSGLNHLIIANTGLCLQHERKPPRLQGQLVAGRVSLFDTDWPTPALEGFIKEFMAMAT